MDREDGLLVANDLPRSEREEPSPFDGLILWPQVYPFLTVHFGRGSIGAVDGNPPYFLWDGISCRFHGSCPFVAGENPLASAIQAVNLAADTVAPNVAPVALPAMRDRYPFPSISESRHFTNDSVIPVFRAGSLPTIQILAGFEIPCDDSRNTIALSESDRILRITVERCH